MPELQPQADERSDTRERFVELDGEIQAIKEEILEINRDILLLEELSLYPHGQQLVVLVSVANNSPVNPDTISLQLDGQTGKPTYVIAAARVPPCRRAGYTGSIPAGSVMVNTDWKFP